MEMQHQSLQPFFSRRRSALEEIHSSHGAAVAVTENGASGGTFSRVSWKQQVVRMVDWKNTTICRNNDM